MPEEHVETVCESAISVGLKNISFASYSAGTVWAPAANFIEDAFYFKGSHYKFVYEELPVPAEVRRKPGAIACRGQVELQDASRLRRHT
jgi:hypothetical protein